MKVIGLGVQSLLRTCINYLFITKTLELIINLKYKSFPIIN